MNNVKSNQIVGKIPAEVLEIIAILEKSNFEAYIVGGCVRDLILGREPKDWDLTTNARPEQIQELFTDHVYENNFGTVGIKTRSENPNLKIVEITPYRLESDYRDNRHPEKINFSDKIEDDLQRRDFTINAMSFNPNKGQLIDLYKGQDDLERGIIRTVGNAEERFGEDALRMFRAIRFAAELGFTINSETFTAITTKKELLKNVSRERIRDEFNKIIMSDNPMIGLAMVEKLDIIDYISPVFKTMVNVQQNKKAHKYDVWEHSLRAMQHAADNKYGLEIRLAALFHDIGKPPSKREAEGKTTFFGHEVVSSRVTHETLRSLNYSKEIIDKTTKLVRWHMFFSDTNEISLSAVRRLITKVGKENIWDLINLRKCDRIGTGRPKEEPYRFRKYQSMIDEVMRDPISVDMLKIDGNDLINKIGINPGPKIGQILVLLLEDVLDNPELNDLDLLLNKASDLNKLDDSTLKNMSLKARDIKDISEQKELTELRNKRHVK